MQTHTWYVETICSTILLLPSASSTSGNFGIVQLILSAVIGLFAGFLITTLLALCLCWPRYQALQAQLRTERSRLPLSNTGNQSVPLTATLERPNNLRIFNNIHSNPHGLHSVSSSTAPLLPPRRNVPASSSGSSTMGRIYEQSGPPLPPRLTASLSRHRRGSEAESFCKEAAL